MFMLILFHSIFHCTFSCIVQHHIILLYICTPVRRHVSEAIPVTFKNTEHGKHAYRVL